MKFNDWLDQEEGRTTSLANHFGIYKNAVTQWRTNGVPVTRMREVSEFSKGAVTVEEMVIEREKPQGVTNA